MASLQQLVLLVAVCFLHNSSGSFWFINQLGSVAPPHSPAPANRVLLCAQLPGLVPRQRRLCQRHPGLMRAVVEGAKSAVAECQRQFKNQRWNCTTLASPGQHSIGQILMKLGSRESAFVYAATSAGIVHSVARACSQGKVSECSCGTMRQGLGKDSKGDFIWGGCSDNVRYAARFGRRFVDARDRTRRNAMSLMNLHNYRAGRKAVSANVRKVCKCHGVSGSCVTRTCWKAVDEFEGIGNKLYNRYAQALQVLERRDASAKRGLTLQPLPERLHDSVFPRGRGARPRGPPKVKKSDLVYLDSSPDYCVNDSDKGSLGTAGRECNVTSSGPDSCDVMCCGRGYDTRTQVVSYKCGCEFVWCCEVKCRTCTKRVDVHTCKPVGQRSNATPHFPRPPHQRNRTTTLRDFAPFDFRSRFYAASAASAFY